MAKMPKKAKSYDEARAILESIIDKPLKSRKGLIATISSNSLEKILSGDAVKESFSIKAHLLAAANIEKLFSNAIEKCLFDFDPGSNNDGLQERKYLYSPMEYNNRIIPVKMTVKIFKNKKDGTRLYSLEAIDFEIKKEGDTGILAPGVVKKSTSPVSPQHPLKKGAVGMLIARGNFPPYPSEPLHNYNIAHIFDSVNEYLQESAMPKREIHSCASRQDGII